MVPLGECPPYWSRCYNSLTRSLPDRTRFAVPQGRSPPGRTGPRSARKWTTRHTAKSPVCNLLYKYGHAKVAATNCTKVNSGFVSTNPETRAPSPRQAVQWFIKLAATVKVDGKTKIQPGQLRDRGDCILRCCFRCVVTVCTGRAGADYQARQR